MKKSFFPTVQFVLTAWLLAVCTSAFSQKTVTWKGGAPGRENDWQYFKNWSTGSVPDEFSNVVIPDVSTAVRPSPVIKKGRVEIRNLFLESSAVLIVEQDAELVIQEEEESIHLTNVRRKRGLQLLNATVKK